MGSALQHLAQLWPMGFVNFIVSEPGSHWRLLKGGTKYSEDNLSSS